MSRIATRIEPHNTLEIFFAWSTGETFVVPYVELRFQCPCAVCVDEHTGKRVIRKEQVRPDIRVTGVQLIGRYALQMSWSDGHQTGMYHFDRLFEICQAHGISVEKK